MKLFLSILIAFFLIEEFAYAQQESYPLIVDIKDKSALSIHGESNVVNFKFYQPASAFIPEKMYITASKYDDKLYLSESNLEIPVKNFTSSNRMALRDFHKLVKSDRYPVMHIKLDHIELNDKFSENAGKAVIDVTITNVTKRYMFPITADESGNNFTFDVKEAINIRDFGLSPPVHMMGMLKVDEWITINLIMDCSISPVEQAEITH